MLSSVIKGLTGRMAAVLALLVILVLAVTLGVVWRGAARNEARLQTRIAALDAQLVRTVALQRAEAAACASAADPQRLAAADARDPAARLLEAPPGYDVCARMESADATVLGSLK